MYSCKAIQADVTERFDSMDSRQSIAEEQDEDEDDEDDDDENQISHYKAPVTACQRLQKDLCDLETHIYEQSARRLQQLLDYKNQIHRIFVQEAKRLESTAGYGYESVDMMELNETTEAIEQNSTVPPSQSLPSQSYLDIMREARAVAERTPQKEN